VVSTADVNGDGKLDLIVANAADSTVSVLLGNGNGTFQSQQTYPTGNQYFGLDTVAIGDVNGDGYQDVVVNNYYDGTLTVLINSCSGTFTAQPAFSVVGSPTWVASAT